MISSVEVSPGKLVVLPLVVARCTVSITGNFRVLHPLLDSPGSGLLSGFCSSTPVFAPWLPSDSTSRWTPLPVANGSRY